MCLSRDEDQQLVIVDWRAPVANLYYEGRLGRTSYRCPAGEIGGELSLKRQFSIAGGVLREILDIDITTNDEFLQACLGGSADNRLKEIVSTIQAEQNRIIRARDGEATPRPGGGRKRQDHDRPAPDRLPDLQLR